MFHLFLLSWWDPFNRLGAIISLWGGGVCRTPTVETHHDGGRFSKENLDILLEPGRVKKKHLKRKSLTPLRRNFLYKQIVFDFLPGNHNDV